MANRSSTSPLPCAARRAPAAVPSHSPPSSRLHDVRKVLGLLEGKTVEDIREQLDQDYKSTMLANWGVFVPAAVVNLAFCPPELRVLFLNVSKERGLGLFLLL